ncbi:MAG: biotin--[acetyl-CoA-carboxylase] ligase [Thermofilum sp. ex4484_79]|nr:MAG: biotin--[acetyl-CoA-carboxylase] ligase [Thermofilum sp. ex4484_79]
MKGNSTTNDMRLRLAPCFHFSGIRTRFKVFVIDSTTSTQDIAKDLAESGAAEGTTIVAREMNMGRGRFNRKWYASRGGLWTTVILRPHVDADKISLFSLLIGLAVAKGIEKVCKIKPSIKWPNDILLRNRKVCGVLIETSISADHVDYLLVGIGLNVNNEIPYEIRETAISLSQCGCDADVLSLLKVILEEIDKLYTMLENGHTNEIISEWKSYNITLGRTVRAIYKDEVIRGKAIDVDEHGSLILLLDNGQIHRVTYEEIYHLR